MAKLNKRLRQLVNKMIKNSLDRQGLIDQKKALMFSRSLKKLPLTQAILALSEFTKGIKREMGKTQLVVESAVSLKGTLQKQIIHVLSKDYKINKSIFNTNPILLGGIKVKIGDTLIDDSVRARVNQLTERITSV